MLGTRVADNLRLLSARYGFIAGPLLMVIAITRAERTPSALGLAWVAATVLAGATINTIAFTSWRP